MKAKNTPRYIIGAALILLVPLVAMLFSNEVKWDLTDFAAVGALLIGGGLIFELITTKVNAKYRNIIAIVVTGAVLLIWVELAVGIFGTPIAGS